MSDHEEAAGFHLRQTPTDVTIQWSRAWDLSDMAISRKKKVEHFVGMFTIYGLLFGYMILPSFFRGD